MAIVKPFKGIRPPKDLVEKVESRPYDVLDSEEARAEAGDNEMSLYHIIKPEIDFPVGTSEYDPRVYEKAAEKLGDTARCEEDVLSYIAFPPVAEKFFAERQAREEKKVRYSITPVEEG